MKAANAIQHLLLTIPAAATATFLALFPIVNPFGGIPLFFSITSGFTPKDRYRAAIKTGFYVFVILVTFMFFGRFVLNFFGISLPCPADRRRPDRGQHCLGNGDGRQSHHGG